MRYNTLMMQPGMLYVVGTPIGNREDITLRALRILAETEVIVCEDTRVTQRLLGLYSDEVWQAVGVKPRKPHLARLDENFEARMIPKVITWLETGTSVALVTDAGMPAISDPGWRVVDAVREAGYSVTVIPGPSALDAAIAGSGMDVSRVWFGGFLPKKEKHQQELLDWVETQLQAGYITVAVVYESPKRLKPVITSLSGRKLRLTVCGELTKTHERVIRGTVDEVLDQLPVEIKGEWVIVMGKE